MSLLQESGKAHITPVSMGGDNDNVGNSDPCQYFQLWLRCLSGWFISSFLTISRRTMSCTQHNLALGLAFLLRMH